MNKKTAVYQGTFDPFTNGHLAVIEDALSVFDEVGVVLMVNPAKKPLFSVEERKQMILDSLGPLSRCVWVADHQGLLADYMREKDIICCVRGIRNERDYGYELNNHQLSQAFYPQLKTIFLPCQSQWGCVSSSAVKDACICGKLPKEWVSVAVAQALLSKFPQLKLI